MRWVGCVFLLSACNFAGVGMDAIQRQMAREGFVSQTVAMDGSTLHYWVGGEGPPLLMLHGFGGDGLSTWRLQMAKLSETRTLIVPDLLWFGESHSDREATLPVQVDAQLALLDLLDIESVDVMGISYGGFVSLHLLQRAPDLVSRLILVDSPGPVFSESDIQSLCQRFGVQSPEEIFVATSPEQVEVLLDLALYNDRWVPRFVLKDIQEQLFSQHHDALRGLIRDLPSHRSAGEEILVTVPSLVIWGSHDEVFPVERGRQLADRIDAQFVVIDETAHAPPTEKPTEFNDAVLESLTASSP